MSWAADLEVDSLDQTNLSEVLRKAMDVHKIPVFCANPDKGRGYNVNKTYPYIAYPDKIFCIGAAASSGSHWSKIDPEDKSAHFYLPGVDLGIHVHTREGEDQPPSKWEKYSGSSLSCALAAGLDAMILHIAKVCEVPEENWKSLKSRDGMRQAFQKIDVGSDHNCLKDVVLQKYQRFHAYETRMARGSRSCCAYGPAHE
jgi:hypothetical protein